VDKKKPPRITKESLERLIKIHEQIKENRKAMDGRWKEIAQYVNYEMNWGEEPDGKQKPEDAARVYDSTASKASNILADGIQGYSFARNQAWFKVALEGVEETGAEESAWLQYVEKGMYRQIQRSNFYEEGRVFVKCAADFGTAVMTREDDVARRMPVYKTQHLNRCSIDENSFGEADVLFREFWMDAFKAAETFGKDRLTKGIKEAYDNGKMKQWKFTQAILPVGRYGIDAGKPPEGKTYYTVYWADVDRENALRDGYYQLEPFFCWGWSRNMDGGVWGAGNPGSTSLSDIKEANSVRGDLSRLEQQMGRPPLKASEGLNGRINLRPNGVTSLRPGEDFAFMQNIGDPKGMMEDLQGLRKAINEAYYTDFFLILSMNMEKQKTATEVAGIQGEKAALMSAFYGRLTSEFLEPLLEDLFLLELASGRAPPPPETLMHPESLRLDMISPLAQMQRRYLSLGSGQQALAGILALAEVNPQVLDNFDMDRYVRLMADAYAMDKRVIVDEEDVARIRKARAQQQAEMQQRAMQMQGLDVGSKALGNMAKLPPEIMEQVQGAMQ
jgi:hypothetical protein